MSNPRQGIPQRKHNTQPTAEELAWQTRAQCLRYALVHNEIHGVWGGLSETERRELQRRRELETT